MGAIWRIALELFILFILLLFYYYYFKEICSFKFFGVISSLEGCKGFLSGFSGCLHKLCSRPAIKFYVLRWFTWTDCGIPIYDFSGFFVIVCTKHAQESLCRHPLLVFGILCDSFGSLPIPVALHRALFFYWGFLMNLCTFSGITLMVFQIPVNVLPERFPRSMLMSHLNMLMRCFNDRWYENWCVCQASFNTSTRHLIWLEFGLNWKWFSITSCRKRLCQDSCRFFAFFSAIQEIRETSLIKRHASLFQLS